MSEGAEKRDTSSSSPPVTNGTSTPKGTWAVVVVAALGYFVDIYDLLLFGIVRTASLKDIGVKGDDVLDAGVLLLNAQMIGLLLGGFVWGVLGDKRGRVSVLFASIFLYSAANIANAFVDDVTVYAVLRFIAGVGLAGELGAGITLVAETLPKEKRGLGTTIVATVGIAGAVVAAFVAEWTSWRVAFGIGGALGCVLLVLRVSALESGLFQHMSATTTTRGSLRLLFSSWSRVKRLLGVVLVAVPIWYVVGILVTFAPEIGKAMGLVDEPKTGRAILVCYAGLVVGDLASGLLSQWMKSRRRVLFLFIALTAALVVVYFQIGGSSLTTFYVVCAALGVSTGYWAVFVTTAAEQMGTNLRATVTTTAPNLVRATVVPMTWLFRALIGQQWAVTTAAATTGVVVFALALWAWWSLPETFGKDLGFVEE